MPEQPVAHRERLQQLLYELFQFDSLDLDFGLYAVMNQRRDEIAAFIETGLLDSVGRALAELGAQGRQEAQAALEKARTRVLHDLSPDALDGDELAPAYRSSGIGKEYLAAKAALDAASVSADVEAQVFNDLYAFFARYYQDGDFIAQRRYGSADHYAIPYNGQEVHLHWANADQYYVKSGAFFQNYAFRLPPSPEHSTGVAVQLRLTTVDTPRDNIKGEKRLFVLAPEPVQWDAAAQTLTLRFEYRPPTDDEAKRLGKQKQQEKLLDEAHAAILKAAPTTTIKAQLGEADPARPTSATPRLAYHLTRYAVANTRDFFVHKDLRGFLTRELDFYLKAEVLQLDDLDLADAASLRRAAARTAAIRCVALDIVAFLDQLESFQRRLFLKRKFVLQSDYCLTLDKIPAERRAGFYAEILANAAQRAQWRELYGIELNEEADLAAHPRLLIDTALFPPAFKARLLAAFDDLDAATDGLLVHAENFQALRLLTPKYEGQIKCIHIDPPYNTQSSGFLYKNTYQHSSWLAMMRDRVDVAIRLLTANGVFSCHIDEYELERLFLLLDQTGLVDAGTMVWDKGQPNAGAIGLATQHEYVQFRSRESSRIRVKKRHVEQIHTKIAELLATNGAPTGDAIASYRRWLRSQTHFSAAERTYDQFDASGKAFRSDNMSATDRRKDPKFYVPLRHPVTGIDCPVPEFGWRYTPESISELGLSHLLLFGDDHTTMPRKKSYMEDTADSQLSTMYRSGARGKTTLDALGFEFPFAHPVDFYRHILDATTDEKATLLDFFAGSGTTGHAVINLNREDGGSRKYILVEMGDYFDSVLKPRIMKVAYAPEWKDGKPVQAAPTVDLQGEADPPHMLHYIRLESYDDAFHNLTFRSHDAEAQSLLSGLDDYMLTYRLDHLTAGSPTLLNVAAFSRPFDYRLKVTGADGVLREQPVDLVATFNLLLGLAVRTIRSFADSPTGAPVVRVLGTNRRGERVCVLWRNVPDLDDTAALDAERDWLGGAVLAGCEYDLLYVNGENTLPDALSTEDELQRRMMEGVA